VILWGHTPAPGPASPPECHPCSLHPPPLALVRSPSVRAALLVLPGAQGFLLGVPQLCILRACSVMTDGVGAHGNEVGQSLHQQEWFFSSDLDKVAQASGGAAVGPLDSGPCRVKLRSLRSGIFFSL
jgi:hypothetical protein